MKTITIWILLGALVASMRWNLMHGTAETSSEPVQDAPSASLQCEIDPTQLGLSIGQCLDLEILCREQLGPRKDYEAQAQTKLAELRSKLGAETLDEAALHKLVSEVSELREAALGACVDEVSRVRAILDPPQVEQLMQSCCPEQTCAELETSSD